MCSFSLLIFQFSCFPCWLCFPFFPGRLSILATPEESPFLPIAPAKVQYVPLPWLEAHYIPEPFTKMTKPMYDLGSSVHHFWFSKWHQLGCPGIFPLKDNSSGLFLFHWCRILKTLTWSLRVWNCSLSFSFLVISLCHWTKIYLHRGKRCSFNQTQRF